MRETRLSGSEEGRHSRPYPYQVKGKSTFIKEEKRQTPMIVIEPRIRLDDWEMRADVQQAVAESWEKVTTENLAQYADLNGFREEFLRHHGFGMPGVDYSSPIDPTKIGSE